MPSKTETIAAFWPWQKSLLLDKELLEAYAPSVSIFAKESRRSKNSLLQQLYAIDCETQLQQSRSVLWAPQTTGNKNAS